LKYSRPIQDILPYEYKLGGCKTGRYTTSAPAFHNFAKDPPEATTLTVKLLGGTKLNLK